MVSTEEHQLRQTEAQHVRTPRSTHIPVYLTHLQQKDAQTRARDKRGKSDVVERPLTRRRYTNVVTERRRKSRLRLLMRR